MITKVDYQIEDSSCFIRATGHATEVMREAHQVADAILGSRPWRFIQVTGNISETATLDSDMDWKLLAVHKTT